MDEISYSGATASPKRKLPKRLIIFVIFFLIIIALIAGVFYFVTRDTSDTASETEDALILPDNSTEEITEEPTPTEEEEKESPTPTKAAANDDEDEEESSTSTVSSGSVAVQNGSGEAGVAGSASTTLKNAGFTIASTGNADNFDYEGVTIQVKNSKKAILSDLEDALSKDYTISDTSTDLPESTNYDALVIIGK